MKILLFISLFFLSGLVSAQEDTATYYVPTGSTTYAGATPGPLPPWYENLEKYWYYRYKLVNDFMYIGPNAGESLPANRRELGSLTHDAHATGNAANRLYYGSDNTIDLGHYLSTLAIEYRQLKNNGFNTDRTVYELTYAQNALYRLCNNSGAYENAEQYGGLASYPGIGVFNNPTLRPLSGEAFFLRDDVPFLTMTDHDYNYKYWKHFNRDSLLGADTTIFSIRAVDSANGSFTGVYWGATPTGITRADPDPGGGYWGHIPNCESQDQLADVFLGESLVSTYLDGDPSGLHTAAQEAVYKLAEWPSRLEPVPIRSYFSIPDVNLDWDCAKDNCSVSGLFGYEAPAITKAANNICGSDYISQTALLMSVADIPTSIVAPASSYPMLFETDQYLSPQCGSSSFDYLTEQTQYNDGYVAIARNWTFDIPTIPGIGFLTFAPPIVSTLLTDLGIFAFLYNTVVEGIDYPTFAAGNIPIPWTSAPSIINTSWRSIKNHSGSDYNGTPHLPLIYQLYWGDQSWYWNSECEALLNSAPPCGVYNYEHSSAPASACIPPCPAPYYPNTDWSGNDRLSEPYHRQGLDCSSNEEYNTEGNGLDYMELFNLYALERGNSYMQGMMNSYYYENFGVNYPDVNGYGSTSNKLKLNWLEYVSATDVISGTNGWVDFRGAKVIDLKPGFHAENGSFFLAHISDYSCNGGNLGSGPYHFAELNPSSPEMRRASDSSPSTNGSGFFPIVYLPQGPGYIAEKLPVADPMDHYADSLLTAHPELEEFARTCQKYAIINSNIDEIYLNDAKERYGWTDDTIAKYKKMGAMLHPDSIQVTLYPNPANNSICTLSYQLSKASSVNIKLFNNIGQDFTGFINHYDENGQPGINKVIINSDRLVAGLYFVTIQIGTQIVSKKLTVM